MASVKCPECGERVKIREDSTKLRCAECGTSFRVMVKDEEEEREEEQRPRPRARSKPPAKKTSGTKIAAIAVGGLLVVGLVALGIILLVRKGGKDDSPAVDRAKVTVENFNKVKPGMDLAEVESILGGSKSSSENDMRDAYRKAFGEIEAAWETGWSRFGEGTNWRRWDGKNYRVWVVFAKTKDGKELAAFSTSLEEINGGHKHVTGFATFAGNSDLEKMNDDRKKESAIRDDKKWVRGPQARELIVGEWRDELSNGYLFAPDGKATDFGRYGHPGDPLGTYRVIDDRYLEYTAPPLFNPPPGHPQPFPAPKSVPARYEYLVNRDEMALIDASPHPIWGLRSYYRMPAVAGSVAEAKLVAPIIADLKGGDATKRQLALFRLKNLGPNAPTAVGAMIDLIRSPDQNTMNEAANILGAMKEAAIPAIPTLVEQFSDPNSRRALTAVLTLGRMGPAAKSALPALRELVKQTTDGRIKNEAGGVIRGLESARP